MTSFHKILSIAVVSASAIGCQTFPETRDYNTPELTIEHIHKETDEYRKTTMIVGPKQYFDQGQNSGTFVLLRSFLNGNEYETQAYVQVLGFDWAFYESAHWKGGQKAEFLKIDSEVKTSSTAYVLETFAVGVPSEMLRDSAANGAPLEFKAYGKRGEKEVVIPSPYVRGFQKYLADSLK